MSWLVQTTGKSHQTLYLCRTIGNSSLIKPVSSDLEFCTVKTIIVSIPQWLPSQPCLLISNWVVSAWIRASSDKNISPPFTPMLWGAATSRRWGSRHRLALSGPGKVTMQSSIMEKALGVSPAEKGLSRDQKALQNDSRRVS